jgi:hypothetical protein
MGRYFVRPNLFTDEALEEAVLGGWHAYHSKPFVVKCRPLEG